MDRCKLHKLSDILFITIAASLSGAEDREEIEDGEHGKKSIVHMVSACNNANSMVSYIIMHIFQSGFVKVASVCPLAEITFVRYHDELIKIRLVFDSIDFHIYIYKKFASRLV